MSEHDEAAKRAWRGRIDAYWDAFDDDRPDEMIAVMRELHAERPAGDAHAEAELGGAFDALGREAEAVPHYRAAIEAGLDPLERERVRIQVASTLRNLGRPHEALAELEVGDPDAHGIGDAHAAFTALALRDAGRADEAIVLLVRRLGAHLTDYRRAVLAYADELETEIGRSTPSGSA